MGQSALRFAILFVATTFIASCARSTAQQSAFEQSPENASPTVARSDCYVGSGFWSGFPSGRGRDTSAVDADARTIDSWAVLDSLTTREAELDARVTGARAGQQPAMVLTRRDNTLDQTFSVWQRGDADSIVIRSTRLIPGITWRLGRAADTLRGEAVLVHDVLRRDAAGTMRRSISRWPVMLVRSPCANVPMVEVR